MDDSIRSLVRALQRAGRMPIPYVLSIGDSDYSQVRYVLLGPPGLDSEIAKAFEAFLMEQKKTRNQINARREELIRQYLQDNPLPPPSQTANTFVWETREQDERLLYGAWARFKKQFRRTSWKRYLDSQPELRQAARNQQAWKDSQPAISSISSSQERYRDACAWADMEINTNPEEPCSLAKFLPPGVELLTDVVVVDAEERSTDDNYYVTAAKL